MLYININILINQGNNQCHYHPIPIRAFRMKDTGSVIIYFPTVLSVTDLSNLTLGLNYWVPALKYPVLFFKLNFKHFFQLP